MEERFGVGGVVPTLSSPVEDWRRFVHPMDVTISLRNLPPAVEAAILQKSKQLGISLNQAAEQLILAALHRPQRNLDFDEFCGLCTEEQGRELQERLHEMRKVDGADWAQ